MPTKSLDLEKARQFTQNLLAWLWGKKKVLVLTHDNPDPDALASAYALRHLILVKTGADAVVAHGGSIGRGENRAMVEKLEINSVPFQELDLEAFDVVALVDSQPGTGNNSYPADRVPDIVVDHHPQREQAQYAQWLDIRPDYGACATMLFEYLLSQEVYIGTKLATILFYAIKSETQDLGREWAAADRAAYLRLVPLCNNHILHSISQPAVPASYFCLVARAIANAKCYGPLLIFNLYAIDQPDIVAEMADYLLRLEGTDLVLGFGYLQGQQILSIRSRLDGRFNAGELMQQLVQGWGTGGGHTMVAGGQLPEPAYSEERQLELEHKLVERLCHYLQLGSQAPKSVCRELASSV